MVCKTNPLSLLPLSYPSVDLFSYAMILGEWDSKLDSHRDIIPSERGSPKLVNFIKFIICGSIRVWKHVDSSVNNLGKSMDGMHSFLSFHERMQNSELMRFRNVRFVAGRELFPR